MLHARNYIVDFVTVITFTTAIRQTDQKPHHILTFFLIMSFHFKTIRTALMLLLIISFVLIIELNCKLRKIVNELFDMNYEFCSVEIYAFSFSRQLIALINYDNFDFTLIKNSMTRS